MIVGHYSPNTVCESWYFRIFFICFRWKLLKYCSIKPAFPFKVMLLYNTLWTCLGWSTEYYQMQSIMFLLKCYVLQALVYSFLCFLARQIYYSFCVFGCHLHLSLHPGLCGYFHWKRPWLLYPSQYFHFMVHHGLQEGGGSGVPISLDPILRLQPHCIFLSSLPDRSTPSRHFSHWAS